MLTFAELLSSNVCTFIRANTFPESSGECISKGYLHLSSHKNFRRKTKLHSPSINIQSKHISESSHQHFYFKRINIMSILQMNLHSSFINIHQRKYISCVKFRICIIITFSSAILYQVLPSQPVFLLHPKTVNIKFWHLLPFYVKFCYFHCISTFQLLKQTKFHVIWKFDLLLHC